MLAVAERSGMVEEYHDGAVAVVDPGLRAVAVRGEIDRPFYVRSAAKPFQARVVLDSGVRLAPVQLALACASHSGHPVHVAIVDDILAGHHLEPGQLRCPPARPRLSSDRRLASEGDVAPDRRYHGCSGKHAAMLAACAVNGWPTDSYLDPAHPLQTRVGAMMAEVTGARLDPPGVDGCGAPVWAVTARTLAIAYSRLGTATAFSEVRRAMARYPRLVAGYAEDADIATWLGIPVKGGAAGCMGAVVHGYGIGAKAWSGAGAVAAMGVMMALDHLGLLPSGLRRRLDLVASPLVSGGGEEVGRIRPVGGLQTP